MTADMEKSQAATCPYNTNTRIRSQWWLEKRNADNDIVWTLYMPHVKSGGAPTKEKIFHTSLPGESSQEAIYAATGGAEQLWNLKADFQDLLYISKARYNDLRQEPDWDDLQYISYDTAISYVSGLGKPYRSMWDMYDFAVNEIEAKSLDSHYILYLRQPRWGMDPSSIDVQDYMDKPITRTVFLKDANPSFVSGTQLMTYNMNFAVGKNALSEYVGFLKPPEEEKKCTCTEENTDG